MTALLSHIAALVARRPRVATLTVFLTIIGLIGGAIAVGGAFKDDFTVPGIESQRAQDLLEQRFPAQSGTSATLVFRGDLKAADQALTAIARQPHVASVDPLQTAKDGHTAYAVVNYDQPATALDASARERLESATKGLDVAMAGEPIDGAATGGFPIGELIGLAVAVLLLLAVLRNLRAAGNALMAAFAGIALGFGALMWAAAATEVPGLAPTLAGMLGLGAGIDYALLLAARQQEELRAGRTPAEAAQRANATAGHSALTAAGIVLVSISGLLVTGIPFVGRAGVAAGLVVLACAIVCVVLLPARFARSGERMLPRRERKSATPRAPWATRRPWLALIAAGAVTVVLAAPAVGLELGQPDDRNLSTTTTQRQAYDRLAAGFGAGVNGPLVVAVALPEAATTPFRGSSAASPPTARSPTSPSRSSTRPATRQSSPSRPSTARRTPRPARSSTACGRTRSPPRCAARPPTRTSAAAPPATATRRSGSRRGSRSSPPRSSASRCCSCWPRSVRGGSR